MRLKAKPRLLAAPFRPQGGGHFPAAAARPPDTHTASQREKYGRSRFSLGEQRGGAVPVLHLCPGERRPRCVVGLAGAE